MQFCTLSYSCIETSFHCTHLWDGMLDARRSYHSHTKCGRKMPINHARSISRVLSVCPKRQQLFSSIVQKRCANASCERVQNVENFVCLNTSTQRPHATHQFIAHTHTICLCEMAESIKCTPTQIYTIGALALVDATTRGAVDCVVAAGLRCALAMHGPIMSCSIIPPKIDGRETHFAQ